MVGNCTDGDDGVVFSGNQDGVAGIGDPGDEIFGVLLASQRWRMAGSLAWSAVQSSVMERRMISQAVGTSSGVAGRLSMGW